MSDPLRFKPLQLSGGRFDEASRSDIVGFPLEVIAELARYERLLIKVARELWMLDHPGRQRAPKGFDEGLRLSIIAVDRGSVAPVLERRDTSDGRLFDPDSWVQRSQQTVADAIAAIVDEQPLPTSFPAHATPSLVQFGAGFREDERCVLVRGQGPPVTYTQRARRHLVRIASPEDIRIDGTLIGRLGAFHANKQQFEFSDRSGARVTGAFTQAGLFPELKELTDRDADAAFVKLTCTYSTDVAGHLSAIEDVDDIETIVGPREPLGLALRDLLQLRDGWHDGHGSTLDLSAIEWVRDFAADVPEDWLPDLSVFPTLEGGVLVERQIDTDRWSVEVDPAGDVIVAIFREGATNVFEAADQNEVVVSLRDFLT